MASYPTEEKRDRVSYNPLRLPIIQNDSVPASEAGRAPAVHYPVPDASASGREREMKSSVDRIVLVDGSPSPSIPEDLFYSQVTAAPKLAPLSITLKHNSPTRKGGPESPCTRNGCADSIPIGSRDHVECSASANNGIEHSASLSNEARSPKAATVYSNTHGYSVNPESVSTRSPKTATVYSDTNGYGINPELVNTQSPKAASDYLHTDGSSINPGLVNTQSPYAAPACSITIHSYSNVTVDSNVNAEPPNTSDTYTTWCHTGGLLRSTTSVGPSTTYPLTHGANATNGVVVTPRNDSTLNYMDFAYF